MTFYPRSFWKAVEPSFKTLFHLPTKITIHHLCQPYAEGPMMKKFRGSETLREIQKYQKNELGFQDIGYHRIISPNGDVYEGRDYKIVGSHVRFHNTGNIGILIYGNFDIEIPSAEQVKSLKFILQEIKTNFYHMDIPRCIQTHSEYGKTLCPGQHLSPIVHNLKYGFIPYEGD